MAFCSSFEFVASICQMIFSYPDSCWSSAMDVQLLVMAASRLSFAMGWLGDFALIVSRRILRLRDLAVSKRDRSRPTNIFSVFSPSGRVTKTSCQVASVPFPVRKAERFNKLIGLGGGRWALGVEHEPISSCHWRFG